MRILFVNPGGEATGGAERSLAILIRGLAARGHRLGVVTLVAGSAAEAFSRAGAEILADGLGHHVGGVRRHGSSTRLLYDMLASAPSAGITCARIRSLAARFDAAIVHSNGLRTHVLTPVLLSPRYAVVWSLRDLPPGRLARNALRRAARHAAAVTAPSSWAAGLVTGCRRPVYIIPNPVVAAEAMDRDVARRDLGLPPGRRVVVVLAHLHPSKGQHVAIRAWSHLPPPRPLLVLAGGELYGAPSREYGRVLRNLIEELELVDDVVLLGLVPEPSQLYATADMLVHPAVHPEGFGRSMAEAQLSGVPVIATSLGAARELIRDGESGMLVPAGDPHPIAEAVTRLLADPALYQRLQDGGRAGRLRYLPARHAANMESVYRAVER